MTTGELENRIVDLERRMNAVDGEHPPHHQETGEQHPGGLPKTKEEQQAERAAQRSDADRESKRDTKRSAKKNGEATE